jgi:hypothetical protein
MSITPWSAKRKQLLETRRSEPSVRELNLQEIDWFQFVAI